MQGGVPYIQSLRNQCHNTCSTFYIWHMWNCITLNFVTNYTLRSVQSRIADIHVYIYYIYIYIVHANCIVHANFVLITRKVGGA